MQFSRNVKLLLCKSVIPSLLFFQVIQIAISTSFKETDGRRPGMRYVEARNWKHSLRERYTDRKNCNYRISLLYLWRISTFINRIWLGESKFACNERNETCSFNFTHELAWFISSLSKCPTKDWRQAWWPRDTTMHVLVVFLKGVFKNWWGTRAGYRRTSTCTERISMDSLAFLANKTKTKCWFQQSLRGNR